MHYQSRMSPRIVSTTNRISVSCRVSCICFVAQRVIDLCHKTERQQCFPSRTKAFSFWQGQLVGAITVLTEKLFSNMFICLVMLEKMPGSKKATFFLQQETTDFVLDLVSCNNL